LLFGIGQAIFFDAAHPMEDGYFGEITLTEIGQELILFILVFFFFLLGRKQKELKPITSLVALFLLMSFIREFNNYIVHWIYPVMAVMAVFIWLFVFKFKKIKQSTIAFFSKPPAQWFMAGVLIAYVFARLFGRSGFWRLLYGDESYRLAKAATEEGTELLGYTMMLISAIEFTIYFFFERKEK
jgi:hypothetical protein